MEHIFILFIIFFGVSFIFSMIGMGGGIVYVPILIFAGYSIKQAPAISLILILATSLAAITTFFKNNKIDFKLALIIEPATNIMAFIGGYYCNLVPENILKVLLILVLMVAGTLMFKKMPKSGIQQEKKKVFWLWHRSFNGTEYTVNLPLVIIASACVGILSGMLGISGGIIKLPIIVLLCGVPMDIAIATSTIMVAITAFSGLMGHLLNGPVHWELAIIFAISAVFGGLAGSKKSLKVDKARLKKMFGIALWVIAIVLLVKVFL